MIGTIWYKTAFDINPQKDKRYFLYFGAINYEAKVYFNGRKVGEHEGGFTPFNVEVTNLIQPQDNTVIVKVDNKRFQDAVPTVNTDWWNYGGITRRVELLTMPKTFVRDYFVQLKKGTLDTIEGWVQLDGDNLDQTILTQRHCLSSW